MQQSPVTCSLEIAAPGGVTGTVPFLKQVEADAVALGARVMEHQHGKSLVHRRRVADLLETFDAPGAPPVEASADDLVSLIMDRHATRSL